MKLGYVGLGAMGYPIAGHLAEAGHDVTVFNRTAESARRWAAHYGGRVAATPAEAAAGAEVAFTCVGNDNDVRSVVLGRDGVLDGLAAGSILVDNTTTSAELAVEIRDRALERDIYFLDAPVSGGQSGADAGTLTVMCGGDPTDFNRVTPVIATYARAITLLGPVGSGQRTKMVNQICIAGLLQGLAEGVDFALRVGLEVDQVAEVISKGAAGSWQLENRASTMAQGHFDFGFALDWMRKDLAICFQEADRVGAQLPVARLVDEFYAELQAAGYGRSDTSALVQRLRVAEDMAEFPS